MRENALMLQEQLDLLAKEFRSNNFGIEIIPSIDESALRNHDSCDFPNEELQSKV